MHQLAFTQLLNYLFAGPLNALLNAVGIHPANAAAPINNTFALELLVVLGFIAFFAVVRASLSVEKPGTPQQFAELIHEFIGGQAEIAIGHGYQRFQAFVTCIFLFVLICNLLGLIPGLEAPTQSVVVPFGLAVTTFIYYNFHGIREQGIIGYLKHFAGPVWWIAWLLFPIEVISHVARMMSLTIRLWANIAGAGCRSGDFSGLASGCFDCAGLCVHAVEHDLPGAGCGARSLGLERRSRSFGCVWRRVRAKLRSGGQAFVKRIPPGRASAPGKRTAASVRGSAR
jgi:F-type H+-transporting ATPase subunit a